MADQRLLHHLLTGRAVEIIGVKFVALNLDILIINAATVEVSNRLTFQLVNAVQRNGHLAFSAGAQVAFQRLLHRFPAIKTRLVEAVEVQLEAFGLHQIDRRVA